MNSVKTYWIRNCLQTPTTVLNDTGIVVFPVCFISAQGLPVQIGTKLKCLHEIKYVGEKLFQFITLKDVYRLFDGVHLTPVQFCFSIVARRILKMP